MTVDRQWCLLEGVPTSVFLQCSSAVIGFLPLEDNQADDILFLNCFFIEKDFLKLNFHFFKEFGD